MRRPISVRSPLEGRQLWRIGDWGGASEQIGRRWEELGSVHLDSLVGSERPVTGDAAYTVEWIVVLHRIPELAATVQSAGVSHADALLVGRHAAAVVLEPVDFKWTLETANPKQVGAQGLEVLLEQVADLAAMVAPGERGWHLLDGFFLAPDHAANRAHLAPDGPLDPSWTMLRQVDPRAFFEPLPNWDVAECLAKSDGMRLDSVEACERYYRLGAGAIGAVRKIRAGVFLEPEGRDEGPASIERLRRDRRLTSVNDLIAYLDRGLTARGDLAARLKRLERDGYGFKQFREELRRRGIAASGPELDRRLKRAYGAAMAELAVQIREAGARLVREGRTDADAIAELDAQSARWTASARSLVGRHLDRITGNVQGT
ncbi:MAG: hypothetical protein U0821_14510 [Chloroflexota bacterium]